MDKDIQRTQARIRKQRQRDKERDQTGEDVTLSNTNDVTQYHPILYALTDPIKRKKLESICESLGRHDVLDRVYYGCGAYSLSMDVVSDLLDTTA